MTNISGFSPFIQLFDFKRKYWNKLFAESSQNKGKKDIFVVDTKRATPTSINLMPAIIRTQTTAVAPMARLEVSSYFEISTF